MSSPLAPTPAPVPSATARRSPVHLAARAGGLLGAALATVATVLPWLSVPDVLDTSVRLTVTGVESLEGIATGIAGLVVLALMAVGGRARLFWAVVPATLVVLIAGGNLADCLRDDPDIGGLLGALLAGPDAEYGLWLTLVGGVVALGCALLAGTTTTATTTATTSPEPTAP